MRAAVLATGLCAASIACVMPLGAQATRYASVGTAADVRTTVSTAVVRIPTGSADDPAGQEGAAWLLGTALAAHASGSIATVPGSVTVDVGRTSTTFTLTAPPLRWRDAWSTLEQVLFERPLQGASVERARADLMARLRFEAGSPGADFEREAIGLLASPAHPWARPGRGTPTSVPTLTIGLLARHRETHYEPSATVIALVGTGPDHGVAGGRPQSPSGGASIAWTTGQRLSLVQEVTSAWLAVSYPVASSVGRTELEFMTDLLEDALDPDVADPSRYSLDVRLIDAPGGPVISIVSAVAPEAARAAENRIVRTVERLAAEPPEGDFFQWARRRFRSERLVRDSAPEILANRIADDLGRAGAPRDLQADIRAIEPAALAAALDALGEPRVFLLGPDLQRPEG